MARVHTVKSFRGTSKTADGNLTCTSCGDKIKPGDGYRWWANRLPGRASGSGRRIRCTKPGCTPTIADTTPGRRGELYAMQADVEKAAEDATSVEDLELVASDAASRLTDMATEMTEGAENMEAGFGHETSTSQELRERGEGVQERAEELEQLTFEAPDSQEDSGLDEDEYAEYLDQHLTDQRQQITDVLAEVEV